MKKTAFLLLMIASMAFSSVHAAAPSKNTDGINSSYVIDDANVESLFSASTEVSFQADENFGMMGNANNQAASFKQARGGKSALAAIIIDFFLGGLGIHRAYLGTKTFTWIGYILTCGGIGGLLPLVDLIVLAVNFGDISKYENNPKFFMW